MHMHMHIYIYIYIHIEEMRQRDEIRERLRMFARESSANMNGHSNGYSTGNNSSRAYSTSPAIQRNDNDSPSASTNIASHALAGDSIHDYNYNNGGLLLPSPSHLDRRNTSELPPSYGTAIGVNQSQPSPPPPTFYSVHNDVGRRSSGSVGNRTYPSSSTAAERTSGGERVSAQPPPIPEEYIHSIRSSHQSLHHEEDLFSQNDLYGHTKHG
jgi:hypothetical protein